MTWMPDRGSAPHGRRRNSQQRSGPRSDWGADDLGFDGAERRPHAAQRRLGIPRILGRRARWVGARLRRDG